MGLTVIWHARKGGPVHLAQDEPNRLLAWCGAKRQYRHIDREGALHDVTCRGCLAAIREEQPRAWRS